MLILTRRVNEALIVGDKIVVRILSVSGSQIQIGIDAPREINVVRSELIDTDAAPLIPPA